MQGNDGFAKLCPGSVTLIMMQTVSVPAQYGKRFEIRHRELLRKADMIPDRKVGEAINHQFCSSNSSTTSTHAGISSVGSGNGNSQYPVTDDKLKPELA